LNGEVLAGAGNSGVSVDHNLLHVSRLGLELER